MMGMGKKMRGTRRVKRSDKSKGKEKVKMKSWVPDDMDSVELPKWSLFADVLKEIKR